MDNKICKDNNVPVVIMAGGLGSRLSPITKILPKPLIPIGDTSIVERIIHNFTEFGYRSFYLSINYMKDIIINYFRNKELDYDIDFIIEEDALGTAGSLHLIKNIIREDFFLSNCDILVEGNYKDMMDYHKEKENMLTCIASINNVTVPYGVFKVDTNNRISKFEEKPVYPYIVNTGLYILSYEILQYIPAGEFFNITDLIDVLLAEGKKIGVYPILEKNWLDMGNYDGLFNMLERFGI